MVCFREAVCSAEGASFEGVARDRLACGGFICFR
jgi:hypothetical protein